MSSHLLDRRGFLGVAAGCLAAPVVAGTPFWPRFRGPLFQISLAEWSLHKALQSGALDNLGFPAKARSFGIEAIEYVNSFFKDKARDAKYLAELKQRCDGEGVKSLLIMCDGEGALGDPDDGKRKQAVENHHQWVEAARILGCHSIRVNAQSQGKYDEQQKLAADGLRQLCEYADRFGIYVIVENHGGLSSDGKWLAGTLRLVGHSRVGTLPDFGNFRLGKDKTYDRYQGVDELMPFAQGVSAKSHDFDEQGNEIHTNYERMLDVVVVKHRYRSHIGIEYEGSKLSEDDGIVATKKLLERCREQIERRLGEESGK